MRNTGAAHPWWAGRIAVLLCALPVIAALLLPSGCHESTSRWVLTEVTVVLPPITGDERPLERAGSAAEPLVVAPGGTQTLLVSSRQHDNPEVYDDEWYRTMVVVLDGAPAEGTTCEVSPDNGRLIVSSAWLPARRPYVGLEGSVRILKSEPGRVLVDCALRSHVTGVQENPDVLRGRHWFDRLAGTDAALRRVGLNPVGAVPGTQPAG